MSAKPIICQTREIICRWVNDRIYRLLSDDSSNNSGRPDDAYFELTPPDDFLTDEEWRSLEGLDRYAEAHTALIPLNREGAKICLSILRIIRSNPDRPLTVHVNSNLLDTFRVAQLEPDVYLCLGPESRKFVLGRAFQRMEPEIYQCPKSDVKKGGK